MAAPTAFASPERVLRPRPSSAIAARGHDDANLRVLAFATSLAAPFTISFAIVPHAGLALGLYAASQFFYYLGQAPNNAALQLIVPNEMRGQIRAVYQFVFNVVGYGLGPLIVALFTDRLFQGDQYLRYSIALLAACLCPIAVGVVWLGLRPYADALRRSRAWR